VDADLDTLATALYVTIDDRPQQAPQLAPWRPRVGIAPKRSDAELLTLVVMQPCWAQLRGTLAARGRPAPAPPGPVSARPVRRQQAAAPHG
jgi:hypothetical protein